MRQYAIVKDIDGDTHALENESRVLCGYSRKHCDDVTTVWFAPALAVTVTTCRDCCRKLLEETNESLRLHTSK